jgi:hypothetical protein
MNSETLYQVTFLGESWVFFKDCVSPDILIPIIIKSEYFVIGPFKDGINFFLLCLSEYTR